MDPIRYAIAGVGNVASALVQGVAFQARLQDIPPSIQPVIAFDVHSGKVNRKLIEAIRVAPNCAKWLEEDLNWISADVLCGPVLDGVCSTLQHVIPLDDLQAPCNIAAELTSAGAEVLVIVLPTGAQKAAEAYARAAVSAGVGIVNGMPARIAKDPELVGLAERSRVPIIGDDVKSQVGATIVHRALMNVFKMRGAHVDQTLQLDWGGDTDFMNLVLGGRYESGKRQSKTEAVAWDHPGTKIHITAADYVPFLGNVKEAYTRLEGTIFGGAKVRIDVQMAVDDAFNSAGVLTHAVHLAGMATRNRCGGVLKGASAWFCKHPPEQMDDDDARREYYATLKRYSH